MKYRVFEIEMLDGRAIKIVAQDFLEANQILCNLFDTAYQIDDYKNLKEYNL